MPLHRLLARSADALLDGARGNSGAIMAQFFQGLSDKAAELTKFSASTFTDAVLAGSAYARDAIAAPREGTILSVIAAFAHHLVERVKSTAPVDFPTLLDDGLKAANRALTATTSQLAELRKADVVDAGAKGFVHLLEGMLAYVRDGETIDQIDLPADLPDAPMAGDEVDLEYRFCTECIVTGDDIDRRKLREQLSALGGSLVLAGSRYKAKILVHVNEPEQVFALARDYGAVSGEKADDMHKQQHTTHGSGRKVAVITGANQGLGREVATSDGCISFWPVISTTSWRSVCPPKSAVQPPQPCPLPIEFPPTAKSTSSTRETPRSGKVSSQKWQPKWPRPVMISTPFVQRSTGLSTTPTRSHWLKT